MSADSTDTRNLTGQDIVAGMRAAVERRDHHLRMAARESATLWRVSQFLGLEKVPATHLPKAEIVAIISGAGIPEGPEMDRLVQELEAEFRNGVQAGQ